MKRENLTKEQENLFMLGFQYGQRKYISTVKLAAITGMILMFLFGMMVPVRCHAQNPATISKSETVQQDTIPVTILVRISGKPWAFFHDGWEVRKADSVRQQKAMMANEHGFVPAVYLLETVPIYSHLLYLDSRKRPIRKEWVIYQTFKR